MNLNRTGQPAAVPTQLVDAAIDAYVTWREESAAVTAAYESWICASRDQRTTAYEAYAAALGREEDAASAYQARLVQAARLTGLGRF
jgi:hypothetical protein